MAPELVAAIVAAAVSVVVGAGTQVALAGRERHARVYDRRRTALLDAQDSIVALRNRLRDYGAVVRTDRGLPTPALTAASGAFDDAAALVGVRLSRVEAPAVLAAARAWTDDAQQRFVSTQDVSSEEEAADWARLQAAFGAALRSADGLGGRDGGRAAAG